MCYCHSSWIKRNDFLHVKGAFSRCRHNFNVLRELSINHRVNKRTNSLVLGILRIVMHNWTAIFFVYLYYSLWIECHTRNQSRLTLGGLQGSKKNSRTHTVKMKRRKSQEKQWQFVVFLLAVLHGEMDKEIVFLDLLSAGFPGSKAATE